MTCEPRTAGTCAPRAWSHRRDIAAADVSWERAARIADVLPADDPDRLAMRIAPRTLSCANGFRIHKPIAGKRFEELQDLCAAAGDKASVAIAMAGLLQEHLINGRLAEASRLASEHMVLIESIGDPTVTAGLALFPASAKVLTGEIAQALRWSQMVIDLAEGDRALGGYIVGSPLASAYAMRCAARWCWAAPAGERTSTVPSRWPEMPIRYHRQWSTPTPTTTRSPCGVIVADDAALRDIDEALQSAQRAADDVALGFALYTKANALLHRDSAQRERGLDLLRQVREMAVDGRFYALMVPVIDAHIAEEMIRRGDRGAVPLLRASVDELYSGGLLGYWVWGTGVLVEALLEGGTDSDVAGGRGCGRALVHRTCARRMGLARPCSVEIEGSAGPYPWRRGRLSRLRRPLPRTCDIAWLRRTHRDRRGDDMTARRAVGR